MARQGFVPVKGNEKIEALYRRSETEFTLSPPTAYFIRIVLYLYVAEFLRISHISYSFCRRKIVRSARRALGERLFSAVKQALRRNGDR